jgi:hypothetical protein
VINGIRGHAVKIEGGSGNVIAGNYIGTDATGAAGVSDRPSESTQPQATSAKKASRKKR